MLLKPISKRRWKARLRLRRWIPRMVIERWSLTAPEGYKLVWHPSEDFIKVAHPSVKEYRPYQPVKKAWENEQ